MTNEENKELASNLTAKTYSTFASQMPTSNEEPNDVIYNTQQRIFGINKLKQAIINLNSQKRKFKKIWIKVKANNGKTKEQVAFELNKIFR